MDGKRMDALRKGILVMTLSAAGFAYTVSHPVFPLDKEGVSVDRLMQETELVRGLSTAEIAGWIVAKSSFQMIACPNCEWPGGRRDRRNYWRWSPDRPLQITCTHCNTTYPDPRYPCDQVEQIPDPTGVMQEYPYWTSGDGYKYYLVGKVENARKQFMERQAARLADLYVATGDDTIAAQAARVLHRLALVYPHYNPQICRRPGSPALLPIPTLDPPDGIQPVPGLAKDFAGHRTKTHYPYWSNRRGDGWNGWLYSEIPISLVVAYDRIAVSPALDEVSRESGADLRRDIEGFFRATANFIRSYPIYLGNMDPSLIRGLATVGRVIGEPEFVHDAVRRTELILTWQFFPDGNWRECAPSYHSQTVSGLRACMSGALLGYSDPPGYRHPDTGRRFDDLDAARDLPMLNEAISALERMRFPNGDYACVHDTWAPVTSRRRPGTMAADACGRTHLHWAMGHAIMGEGCGSDAVETHLHFSGGYGHTHADTLNLILFGRGREMASDIGYTHTVVRPYVCGSLAHNLVLVDSRDQRSHGEDPPADGHLVSWGRLPDSVQYCEADGATAYHPTVSQYRRALAFTPLPGGGAYVVDVFRVAGGSRHDWVWHGDADRDQDLLCEPPLAAWDGSLMEPGAAFHRWGSAEGEYGRNTIDGHNNSYGLFADLRRGDLSQTRWLQFVPDDGSAVLRTALLATDAAELYAGTLPSVRRAREDSAKAYDFRMPAVLVRREGSELRSVFAAVHEPAEPGGQQVHRVQLLDVTGTEGALAVLCEGDGFLDLHLFAPEADARVEAETPRGTMSLTGRYGFARFQGDVVQILGAIDAQQLRCAGQVLSGSGALAGRVTAVRSREGGDPEDALVVAAAAPASRESVGKLAIVGFGDGTSFGLAVEDVRDEQGASVIVLRHRPGFSLGTDGDSATHTHHPHREMPGVVSVRIPSVLGLVP